MTDAAGTSLGLSDGPGRHAGPWDGIVVNHTHWDREWYMPFERFRVLLVDAVDALLDLLAADPTFTFMLDGQTSILEDYLAVRPERRPELAAHARSGRLVVGPWYTLPDEFIPSPESLVRNLLLGRRQAHELGAEPTRVGYLPDSFGHPAQLPQILAGCDLESAVIFRGAQSATSEFRWAAPDGTRLLTVYLPGGYYNAVVLALSGPAWLDAQMATTLDLLTGAATGGAVLVMNGNDHVGPQPATQAVLDEANRRQDRVRLRQGTLAEYVALVRPGEDRLEVRRGEWRHNRPSRITPGVLSARMGLKQADFRASTGLERGAEPLQAIAWAADGRHDTGLLALAWRHLLQNHPHDSICGCSVDAVHRDNEARFRWAEELGGDLAERGAAAIARRVARGQGDPAGGDGDAAGQNGDAAAGQGLVLFNTLAEPRAATVRQRLHFLTPGAAFALSGADDTPVPHQELRRRPARLQWDPQRRAYHTDGRALPAAVVSPPDPNHDPVRWGVFAGEEVEVAFHADLPAGGWTTLRVVPADESPAPAPPATDLRAGADWLENGRVRVQVGPDGAFDLLDKATGRRFGPLNVFRSEADRGDEYSFCPVAGAAASTTRGGHASVRLVEEGLLVATLEVAQTLRAPAGLTPDRAARAPELVDLPIRSRITLAAGERRVEVTTEVENTARDHRLRALFATGVRTAVADAHGQYEVVRRPAELPAEERTRVPEFDEEQEVSFHPQRAFVDVSDAAGGLAVLNRGLPEYEAEPSPEGAWLGVTLLRCVGWLSRDDLSTRYKHAGPPLATPDAQCLGHHRFEYAVVPHTGDWLAGGVPAEADAYVTPVWTAALPHHPAVAPGVAALPAAAPRGAPLPATASRYRFGPPALRFSAAKRGEDGESLVLRAYNIGPEPLDATFETSLPGAVRRANLAERVLSAPLTPDATADDGTRTYRFPVRPHEVVTLAIRLAEG